MQLKRRINIFLLATNKYPVEENKISNKRIMCNFRSILFKLNTGTFVYTVYI